MHSPRSVEQRVAAQICSEDLAPSRLEWLASEQAELALTIRNLDEVPAQSLLPLSHLAANGSADLKELVSATTIDEGRLEECLGALCEFGFVREGGNGYEATATGLEAFVAVAKQIAKREVFELEGRLQHAKRLRKSLTGI